jgi:cytochrome c peroxidase
MPDRPRHTYAVFRLASLVDSQKGIDCRTDRRKVWLCIVLLLMVAIGIFCAGMLVAGGATAEAPAITESLQLPQPDLEPITPIPAPPAIDPAKLALGENLFSDPRLSHDGTRTCTSCHDVRTNGADANRYDKDADGHNISFNTNTVFNAALSFRLNWEGNVRTLEEQIETAFDSPGFMGTSTDEVLGRLRSDPDMVHRFLEAYGHVPDHDSLIDAMAGYERSLVTPGSRFDQWLEGDAKALTEDEQHGYKLFKSLGCVSCHQGVNVGGNLFEQRGIFRSLSSSKPDSSIKRESLRVPSLRNVATTPPYFHDGSAPTLDDAIRRMAAAQLNRTLTDQQVGSITAFLKTLTGNYRGAPVTAATP